MEIWWFFGGWPALPWVSDDFFDFLEIFGDLEIFEDLDVFEDVLVMCW